MADEMADKEKVENDQFTVVQSSIKEGFAIIDRCCLQNDLTLKARGLLCVMVSMPKNWRFSIKGLAAIAPDGENAIRSALNELFKAGFIVRTAMRDEKGKITYWNYTIYENPNDNPAKKSPVDDFPQLDNPQLDNRTQSNNIIIKEVNNINKNKENEKENNNNTGVRIYKDNYLDIHEYTGVNERDVEFEQNMAMIKRLSKEGYFK